jgi:hypothetical protein
LALVVLHNLESLKAQHQVALILFFGPSPQLVAVVDSVAETMVLVAMVVRAVETVAMAMVQV